MSVLHAFGFLRWPIVLAVLVLFVALRWRRSGPLTWALGCWAGLFAFFRYGFATPIPWSVVALYMAIVTVSLAAYVTATTQRRREFAAPVVSLVVDPRRRPWLALLLVLLPAGAAANAYLATRVRVEPPAFGRTVHPAPPETITFRGRTVDLVRSGNPLRELERGDPAAFRTHLESGRRTYYRNCVFCHGDTMAGDGMYARGLNPIPTNFTEGTIEQLQESYLFWRIAKGGPGLPAEAGPWDSAMPAWEGFLEEQEVWEVVLFLYDFTGKRPRASSEAHE